MGEQITPEAIGKEVGVAVDLRRGHPKPRESKTLPTRLAKRVKHETGNDIELTMSSKGSEADSGSLR
jgi:hypothetical protein